MKGENAMDTGYISDRVGGRFPELPPEIREKLSGPGGITLSEFSDLPELYERYA